MIRQAHPDDAAGIAAIWNPLIRDSAVTFNAIERSPADIAALMTTRADAGFATYVAETEGAVAGFASYAQFRDGIGYGRTMEHTVIMAPAAQGRGLGRVLLGAVETHARGAGARNMIAAVSSANPEGRGFHARLGYLEVAVMRNLGWKFGRWFDLHLMQKDLLARPGTGRG